MVKNCYGFIPKRYRPRPSYYKIRKGNWSAGFIEPNTKIIFEMRVFSNIMDHNKTGKYLHIHKKVDGLDWEFLEGYTSIKLAMVRIREELDLPPEDLEVSKIKYNDISKWM